MRSIIVGTAGHIDHGKSTLVHALTGTDPDRLKEEKLRGITIDLGFAHARIEGINFAFVDVPGHERFVKNMLAGVGGIDLVALVVAADESVMPQTREHFDICRLLRIPAGMIVLSKADLADEETIELARLEIRDLVAGSFLEGAPVVPVSARTGTGLDAVRAALVGTSAHVRDRAASSVTRLPIDRVFSMKGFGTVVTGTLVSGSLAADRELTFLPAGAHGARAVKVRGVQVHGRRHAEATAGQRCAVNLAGVEVEEISRGQNLVTPGAFVETRVADVMVQVLPSARPLRHGARVRFHQGTAEIIGRIGIIGPEANAIEPGARGVVRLRLEAPAAIARGDRYVLRAYSPPVTIAGGMVLDPFPPRGRIRSTAALERCRALMPLDNAEVIIADAGPARREWERRAAATLIADAGANGLPTAALVWRVGVEPVEVDARVLELVNHGEATVAGPVLIHPTVLAQLRESILSTLATYHRASPLSEGVPREELRAQLFRRGHQAVYDSALSDLAQNGRLVLRDRVALTTHRLELSPEELSARDVIETAFRAGGLRPPDAASLVTELRVPQAIADRVLKLLQRQKVLVRVDTILFHDEALQRLKADVTSLKAGGGAATTIDVSTFKERFGVTRKFAIPLLEYLDRERVTRRAGESRILL